jgi:hypothetical protein
MPRAVVPNGPGIGKMLKEQFIADDMHARAERVLAAAQANAPVGETGDLAASLHITDEIHAGRAASHVGADVPYAMLIESQTGFLARALDSAR